MSRPILFAAAAPALVLASLAGCGKSDDPASAAASASAALAAPPAPSVEEKAPAPGPCKASGEAPVELAKLAGDVHGFAAEGGHLYYSSWSVYGGRGDVGTIQKDGAGTKALTSLELEPRGLALDTDAIFFTSGIRLMKVPKAGGESTTPVEIFSSQYIAVDDAAVYGVPADYGPYDRLAKFVKSKRDVEELMTDKRPTKDGGPNGFSRILVHGGNLFVTDAGNGRVFRLGRDGGALKVLATGQDRAYDLAIAGDTLYFTLAKKGHLMSVPADGGKATKVASGLGPSAPIAAAGDAVFSLFPGKTDMDPQVVGKVKPEDGAMTPLATAPGLDVIPALAADENCVYWAQRRSASETIILARKH